MIFAPVVALLLAAVLGGVEAGKDRNFKLTKRVVAGRKYEDKCEHYDMSPAVFDSQEDIEQLAKYLSNKHQLAAWIGGAKGIETEGSILINIVYDSKGKYDYHYFGVYDEVALKKRHFKNEFYAVCSKKY